MRTAGLRVARGLGGARRPSRRYGLNASIKPWKASSFCPPDRILAGAGSDRDVTLFNCFVMGRIPDDMGGIFENLKEAALTLQQGGGIGYDFSTLRPQWRPGARRGG